MDDPGLEGPCTALTVDGLVWLMSLVLGFAFGLFSCIRFWVAFSEEVIHSTITWFLLFAVVLNTGKCLQNRQTNCATAPPHQGALYNNICETVGSTPTVKAPGLCRFFRRIPPGPAFGHRRRVVCVRRCRARALSTRNVWVWGYLGGGTRKGVGGFMGFPALPTGATCERVKWVRKRGAVAEENLLIGVGDGSLGRLCVVAKRKHQDHPVWVSWLEVLSGSGLGSPLILEAQTG